MKPVVGAGGRRRVLLSGGPVSTPIGQGFADVRIQEHAGANTLAGGSYSATSASSKRSMATRRHRTIDVGVPSRLTIAGSPATPWLVSAV